MGRVFNRLPGVFLSLFAYGSASAQTYTVSTFAGGGLPINIAGTSASLSGGSESAAADSSGNVFFTYQNSVLRLDAKTATLTVAAGSSAAGFGGDNGPAAAAELDRPTGVVLDSTGNLYIADASNFRIRKVTNGVITTVAGGGQPSGNGDNGPATSARLDAPVGIAVDSAGNLYIADGDRVRKVAGGIITTVAGGGASTSDGVPPTSAQLNAVTAVAVDSAGNLYIVETNNCVIRKVANGAITTVAGNGTFGTSGDNGAATSAQLATPWGVAVDSAGNIYIADTGSSRIRQVSNGVITTVAGGGTTLGDNGPAVAAQLNEPYGVALDSAGNLYIADTNNNRIRKVASAIITTIAGGGTSLGPGGPATAAQLSDPYGAAVGSSGSVFIADNTNNRVLVVMNGAVALVAGNGTPGFSGDNGPAAGAQLNNPTGVAVDSAGNLYIADYNNSRVRKVANGVITTVAGNGTPGFSGDGGPAANAQLRFPAAVALDSAGNLYIADLGNSRVRKVSNGAITTVAGNGTFGFSGDNGPATAAQLSSPAGVAMDSAGNLYIADYGNNRIREVSNGTITTIAGNGNVIQTGNHGDGGPATSANFFQPTGLAVDGAGTLYVSDSNDNSVRVIKNGVIATLAGGGQSLGDGGPAADCQLAQPEGLATNSAGGLYIADSVDNRIRLLSPSGPGLSITLTHAGSFVQGQSSATYAVTTSNAAATAGKVTVIDTPPTGLTVVSMSGTGWSCTGNVCSRSDALSAGASYPAITVSVNVASNAPSQVINQATVSQSGSLPASATDTTAISGSAPSGGAPVISLVANAEGESPTIAPNTWVEIKGANLSPAGDTRTWQNSDFANGQMPTALDGVSVTVNGQPAYVYYISPTEVNVLTPPLGLPAVIQVQLTNNGVASAPTEVAANTFSPSFFVFSGGPYVAAQHLDGSLVGPTGLYPGYSTPAAPGETIILWANGFGPSSVPVVAGSEQQTGSLPILPVITIGGVNASVLYAGLVSPGEFQFNIVVPASLANGDQPITAAYYAFSTPSGTLLTIHQ